MTASSPRYRLGALWMVVAGFLFALMGVFVKLGARHFSSPELVFYRSLIGLLVIYGIVRHQGLSLSTPHRRLHVLRGLSGFFALMLFFYAISALPLATAITLNYTSPLFLALLLVIVLKERPQWWLIVALIIGFIGVALLLNPSFHAGQLVPRALGLGSGMLAGVAYLSVKQLGQADEPEWRVVFYFTLVSTVGAGLWMLIHTFHAVTWETLPILLGLGTTATLAQLAMTRAYRLGRTLVVGSLAYSTVVFASLFGILLWGEALLPTSWLAIALIVSSGVISTRATARANGP
jgi:drug/metabolite transporter (DMT)-like permease